MTHDSNNNDMSFAIPFDAARQEYFGPEQHELDMEEIVNRPGSSIQYIGRYIGHWEGELEEGVKAGRYHLYTDRQEHKDYLYHTSDLTPFPTIHKMATALGFVEGMYRSQMQTQRPGCLLTRHLDPLDVMFMVPEELHDRCVRVLVMLAPWEYGQIICFGNDIWQQWSAGDIVYFNYRDTWHFTANASWHSRPILQISGLANDDLWDLINNKKTRNINV